MYNFDVSDYDVVAYMPISAETPFWKVFMYSEKNASYEFLNNLPIGAMTAIGLNSIVESYNETFRASFQGFYKSAVIYNHIRYLSPEKLCKLIDYFNELAEMCEIAKRRGRGRKISYEDYELLRPFYLKLKDVAFIADLKEVFDIDYAFDYLHCDGLLKVRDYDTIIKKTSIKTLVDGKDYQEFLLADLDAFFALDLAIVLFGTGAFPKFQMCCECGEVFVTKNLKSQYCPKCDDATKRSRIRKRRWRKNKINYHAEKVNDLYKQLIEFIRARNEDDSQICKEQGEFLKDLDNLKKAVREHTTFDFADTMTEEQVIKWMNTKCDNLKDRLKTYDYK